MSQSKTSKEVDPLFSDEVDRILEEREKYKNNEPLRVGIESEFGVLHGSNPSSSDHRDEGLEGVTDAEQELGAAMAETQTAPMQLDSLEIIERALGLRENDLADSMDEEGLSLLRYGSHPFISIDEIETTDKDRYDVLTETFEEMRPEIEHFGRKEQVNPNSASIPAAICSTQTNIQAKGLEDAVEKANYANMVLPYAVALSGNSRIVEGKDTGFADTRMQLWEMTYNTPETPDKVGAVDEYFDSPEDYYSRLSLFFRDEDATSKEQLGDAIGEYWKDVRIKIEEDNSLAGNDEYPVVEIRPLSMQPSVAEETAVHGFMLGRIAYAQEKDEELMDICRVMENRDEAMHEGLGAEQLHYRNPLGEVTEQDIEAVLSSEIDKAREGLEYLQIDDPGYMDILEDRIYNGTPSDISAEIYNDRRTRMPEEKALQEAMPIVEGPRWDLESPRQTHYNGERP